VILISRAALSRSAPSPELSPAALGAFFRRPANPLPYSKKGSGSEYDVFDALQILDSRVENSRQIVLLYTGYIIDPGDRNKEYLEGWNREHAWPQSRAGMDTSVPGISTDLHNLFAADSSVNSSRSNKAYGEAGDKSKEVVDRSPLDGRNGRLSGAAYTALVWQPPPRARGRVARALLYMACVYAGEGLMLVPGPGDPAKKEMGDLVAILRWNRDYPPTPKEHSRNLSAMKLQGNVNPFVDAPYLADAVRW
jgi:endonuclease I